jgi:hypothetical protein
VILAVRFSLPTFAGASQRVDRKRTDFMSTETLRNAIGFSGAIFALLSWLMGMVNSFVMIANRKEGVPLFPTRWESPVYIIFRPANLTERGLQARRRCIWGIVGFVVIGAITVVADSLVDNFF